MYFAYQCVLTGNHNRQSCTLQVFTIRLQCYCDVGNENEVSPSYKVAEVRPHCTQTADSLSRVEHYRLGDLDLLLLMLRRRSSLLGRLSFLLCLPLLDSFTFSFPLLLFPPVSLLSV